MEKTYTILAFYSRPYSFDKEGNHYEGSTAHVVLLVSEGKNNVGCEDYKLAKDAASHSVGDAGRTVLCDRFGRFIGLRR